MGLYGSGLYGAGYYATPVSALELDIWPPGVLVTVTGLIFYGATAITIYREVAGERTLLRGAVGEATGGDDAFLRNDAEQPFGVPVRYVAVISGTAGDLEVSSAPITTTIDKVAISDAINGNAAQVVILAWPEKGHTRPSTVYSVGSRTVVVSGQRTGFAGAIDLVIESDSAREQFDDLLTTATSGVLQIRQSSQGGKTYGGVDSYVHVRADAEARWSQDGSDPRRRWQLEVVEVEPWPLSLLAAGFDLADLNAAYDVSLYELSLAFPGTLLSIAQADLG